MMSTAIPPRQSRSVSFSAESKCDNDVSESALNKPLHDAVVTAVINHNKSPVNVIITTTSSLPTTAETSSSAVAAQSPGKTRRWWIDFLLVCAVLGLAESARGIVIPTLNGYVQSLGGSTVYLSLVVSVFSVGRLVASFIFGWMSDYYSPRTILIISTVGCIVGDILYCVAGNIGVLWFILVSRLLTGFGTGMLSVARSYVAVTTPADERTLWMAWLGVVQFMGFAVTPALGAISVDISIGGWIINSDTAATYGLLIIEIILCITLYAVMSDGSEPTEVRTLPLPPQSPLPSDEANGDVDDAGDEKSLDDYAEMNDETVAMAAAVDSEEQFDIDNENNNGHLRRRSFATFARDNYLWIIASWLPLLFVLLNLITRGVLSVAETFGTPLFNKAYDPFDGDPPPSEAGKFFLILGFIGTCLFVFINRLTRWIREVDLLVFSIAIMAFGFLYAIDFDSMYDWDITLAEFSVSMVAIWSLGTPISQTLVVSMLSKRLDKKDAGFWMGLITSAGSIGRIIFPPIAGVIYDTAGESWALMFPALTCVVTTAITIYALGAYTLYVQTLYRIYSCLFLCEQPHELHHTEQSDGHQPTLVSSSSQEELLADRSVNSEHSNSALSTTFAVADRARMSMAAGSFTKLRRGLSSHDIL